jgi:hypothetical protein
MPFHDPARPFVTRDLKNFAIAGFSGPFRGLTQLDTSKPPRRRVRRNKAEAAPKLGLELSMELSD